MHLFVLSEPVTAAKRGRGRKAVKTEDSEEADDGIIFNYVKMIKRLQYSITHMYMYI